MNSPKLDLSTTRIFKREDMAEAISLVGKEVYMSDYEDFAKYSKCELVGIRYIEYEDDYFSVTFPFIGKKENNHCPYKYFILAEGAVFVEGVKKEEKKTLRPYKDISEFANETGCEEVGVDHIVIRNKKDKTKCVLLYTGYSDDAVHLGGYLITLKALFENYEFLYEDEWLPFGVEDE